jgi:hypothetical protein
MLFTVCFETDISKPALVFIEITLPIFFFSYNATSRGGQNQSERSGAGAKFPTEWPCYVL